MKILPVSIQIFLDRWWKIPSLMYSFSRIKLFLKGCNNQFFHQRNQQTSVGCTFLFLLMRKKRWDKKQSKSSRKLMSNRLKCLELIVSNFVCILYTLVIWFSFLRNVSGTWTQITTLHGGFFMGMWWIVSHKMESFCLFPKLLTILDATRSKGVSMIWSPN